ncbi:MAG: LysR family transcriptional regulator [Nannocystaceae bacterium]
MDRFAAAEAFVRIVELGSFTACARDLRLRQATVSRWIAALEDELGVALLDRTTRSVRVTDAGERFYAQARELLAIWSNAQARARQDRRELTGRVRVSLPVVLGQRLISQHLAGFVRDHPSLELDLRFTDRYVDLVADGVDLALRVGAPVDSEYRAKTLGVTPRRLVAAPRLGAALGELADPRALARLPCLLHSGLNNRALWSFERAGEVVRVAVRGRVSVDHSETILALAIAGEGVALLASWLVDQELARGRLVALLPEYAAPPAPIQILYAASRHTPAAVAAFVAFLEDALRPALRSGDAATSDV